MWWWLMIAGVGGATPTAPTYLSCVLDNGDGPLVIEAGIDEPNQRVTISTPQRTFTRDALFSPTEIKVPDIGGLTWAFDRTSLGLKRTADFSPVVQVGTCKVKPTPAKRAF